LASEDPKVAAGSKNWDKNFVEITSDYYKELKNTYSHDAGVISLVAGYEKKLELMDEYNVSKRMVEELRPDLLQWYQSFN
jgi:hypothetical protein